MKTTVTALLIALLLAPQALAQEWQWTTPSKGESNTTTVEHTSYPAPKLRFSELFVNPKGKDQGQEWIEIENYGTHTVDVAHIQLHSSNGNTYALKNESPLEAGTLRVLTLPTSFTLRNSGDMLTLSHTQNPTPLAEITYTGPIKEDVALSQFCEISYTTGCMVIEAPATPGQVNIQPPLTITFSHQSGRFTEPFALTASLSDTAGRIYYTFDGNDQDLSNAQEYTTPISIEHTSTIWIFGINGNRSTPIQKLTFEFIEPFPVLTSQIEEIGEDFVEITSDHTHELRLCPAPVEHIEQCSTITPQVGTHSYPHTLPFATITKVELTQLHSNVLLDTVVIPTHPETPGPLSLNRKHNNPIAQFHQQWFHTIIQTSTTFWWSQLPTPGAPNLFMHLAPKEQDRDRDGLLDKDEQATHGTDLHSFDSDGDFLPDGFEVYHHLDPSSPLSGELYDVYLNLYKDNIRRFTAYQIQDYTLYGTTQPYATVALLATPTSTPQAKGTADIYGHFSLPYNIEASWLVIKDQQGIAATPIPLTPNPKKDATPSFLLTAFPNPPKQDQRTQEFLLLTNTSQEQQYISDYDVELQEQHIALPSLQIAPNESLLLTGALLKRALPNSNLRIHLQGPFASTLTIPKAAEGVLYTSNTNHTITTSPQLNFTHTQNPTPSSTATTPINTTPTQSIITIPRTTNTPPPLPAPNTTHIQWYGAILCFCICTITSLLWEDGKSWYHTYRIQQQFKHLPQELAFGGYSNRS